MQVMLQAEQRPKQNHKNEILPAHPQRLFLLGRELGLMLNQENIRSPHCPVSKKLTHLLRHGSPPRDNDGAIEFWRIKDNLQNHFLFCHHWSDEKCKHNTSSDPFSRCKKCAVNGYRKELTITAYSLTTSAQLD